jgi:hypothetical protein
MARERDDLSVRLEWPDDPLEPVEEAPEPAPPEPAAIDERVEALENAVATTDSASLEATVVRLEYIAAQTVDALRALHDTVQGLIEKNTAAIEEQVGDLRTAIMSMLASRDADEQKSRRRERDGLVGRIEDAVADLHARNADLAKEIGEEIRSLKRRLPVRASGGAEERDQLDELVTRVADEVEIRIAAVTPKGKSSRRGGPR